MSTRQSYRGALMRQHMLTQGEERLGAPRRRQVCARAGSRRRQGSGARSPHSTGGCIGQGDTGGWAGAAQRIGRRVESSASRSTRLSRSAAMTSPDGGGDPVTPGVAPGRAPESRAHRPLIPLWSLPRLFRGPRPPRRQRRTPRPPSPGTGVQAGFVEEPRELGLLAVPVAELGEVGVEAVGVAGSFVERADVSDPVDGVLVGAGLLAVDLGLDVAGGPRPGPPPALRARLWRESGARPTPLLRSSSASAAGSSPVVYRRSRARGDRVTGPACGRRLGGPRSPTMAIPGTEQPRWRQHAQDPRLARRHRPGRRSGAP